VTFLFRLADERGGPPHTRARERGFTTRLVIPFAVAAVFAATSPSSGQAAATWLEIKTPSSRVTVVTDAPEPAGRRAAWQIAQFDRALQKRFTWLKGDAEPPLVVFASADEAMIRSMAPEGDADKDNALSSYLIASTQHVGAMRTDLKEPAESAPSPFRGFYRGRAGSLIDSTLGKSAPPWLARGLKSFLADSVVKEKEILLGRMTAAEDGSGANSPPPQAAEFFRDTRAADTRFDRLAGLFIQYLLVAENGRNASALDAVFQAAASRASAANLQAAQAKVAALYPGFAKYLGSKKTAPLKVQIDPAISISSFAVRTRPAAEALMLRAEALLELNRPVDVRGVLRQAKEADPKLARPLEIEAILYEREQRGAEAKQAIEAAIQLGSKNASLYYRLAQLQWGRTMTKPLLQSVQKLLETARDLSQGDASLLSYLAEVQGDLGLVQPALESARQGASAAGSSDVYAQMALARAQWNAKQTDEAVAAAQKALGLAKVASQKQRVQEFLTFAAKNKKAQATGTKPWTTQFGPPPGGSFASVRPGGVGATGGASGNRVGVGQVQTVSADGSAITDCFANRNDAACSRAVPVLETACADKQATSCVSLGSLYEGGFGVVRDRRKGAGFYKTACDMGDKPGCARLAALEAQGVGTAPNAAKARKTLESLCTEKVPEACIGLAQILRQTGFAVDRDRAKALLKTACEGGSAEACGLATSR
jgi:TPR repeat protein